MCFLLHFGYSARWKISNSLQSFQFCLRSTSMLLFDEDKLDSQRQEDQSNYQSRNTMTINTDEGRSISSNVKPNLTRPTMSEAQVLLDNFMERFRREAGSQDNVRENKESNLDEPRKGNENGEIQFNENAPKDAFGCNTIQTLNEFIDQQLHEGQNPKEQFFKLQEDFYLQKYQDNIHQTIEVNNITQDTYRNFIVDLQMEIVTTSKGCVPVVKTVEQNSKDPNSFVKVLKFYNFDNGQLVKQIVVDQTRNPRLFEISLLQFENNLIFFKRDEDEFKLCVFNVIQMSLSEIPGFVIKEPTENHINYHLMFSREFGPQTKSHSSLESFLADHYVFCQSYQIGSNLEYINRQMVGFNLTQSYQNTLIQLKPESGHYPMLSQPIEHVCHIFDPETKKITFIAFDSFNSHHFILDPHLMTYTDYTSFYGLNETHMQRNNKHHLQSPSTDASSKHQDKFCPFYKHQHPLFLIQSTVCQVSINGIRRSTPHYFTLTNQNQHMLIYPNYQSDCQKTEVLEQIAQKHQYSQSNDQEFNYQEDYETRMKDYFNAKYRKVSVVSGTKYDHRERMCKLEHLMDVLPGIVSPAVCERVIVSTDQESCCVYVFSDRVQDRLHSIEYIKYDHTQATSKSLTSLSIQIDQMQTKLAVLYGPQANTRKQQMHNNVFYINSIFANVISHSHLIKTDHVQGPPFQGQPSYLEYFIRPQIQEYFILVEDKQGGYLTLRIKKEASEDQLRLQMYARNRTHYVFFFSLINDREKLDRKHHFFAIKKTKEEVDRLAALNAECLVEWESDIVLFKKNPFSGKSEAETLRGYTQMMKYKQLLDFQATQFQDWLINLTFEKVIDMKFSSEFVPIIYQERMNVSTHHLLVFDVHKMKVVKQQNINSNMAMRSRLRMTTTGFGEFTLTRTSDYYKTDDSILTLHSCDGRAKCTQDVKYQISSQFYLNHVPLEEYYDDRDDTKRHLNPAMTITELIEFTIRFNCCEKNSIRMVGMKYLLNSKAAMDSTTETFRDLTFIPWITNTGHTTGCQLVLKDNDDEQPSMALRLLDQEINTLFQFQSQTVQFGVQKVMINPNNQSEFIVVVAAQLKQRVWLGDFFDISETHWVLHKLVRKLLSQNQAKFENYVLDDDYDLLQRTSFYKSQEVLHGRSLNDISLRQPREIAQGLEMGEEQVSSIEGSLIEEACGNDPILKKSYLEMRLCEKNLLIQLDFNFCSTIRIAGELNENQSVKVLLKKIFEINSIDYQDIFMLELPVMLKMPRIDRIYDFLHRDYAETKEIEKQNQDSLASGEKQMKARFLNFEDFLNHPFLPPFLSTKVNYHTKVDFKDFHNSEQEIIQEIVQKNPYMTWNVQTYTDGMAKSKGTAINKLKQIKNAQSGKYVIEEKNIEVEHSAIDFQRLIIGEKIRAIQEKNFQSVNFNDNLLANIFNIENEEDVDFYNCDAVKKVVDFQFQKTRRFLKYCFFIYTVGFVIPFLLSTSVKDTYYQLLLFVLCMITQAFFMLFELAQLKEQRLDYFKDPWNLLDSSQFAFFTVLFVFKVLSKFQADNFFDIVLKAFILIQTFNKCFHFVRIWDNFNFIFTMSFLVISEILPFLTIVVALTMAICKLYTSLHMSVDDPSQEYKFFDSQFMKLMLQTYKANKGEVNVPSLDEDMTARVKDVPLAQFVIFSMNIIVWTFQQLVFIFLGASFGSKIIQAYEKHSAEMPMRLYRVKAKFNAESFDIINMFSKQRNFKVVCFAFDKKLKFDTFTQWNGFANAIDQQLMVMDYEQDIKRQNDSEVHQARFSEMMQAKDAIDELNYKLNELTKHLSGYRRCCCEYNQ